MGHGLEAVAVGDRVAETEDLLAVELDDLAAAAADHVIVRALAEGVLVAGELVAELHLLDDAAVDQQRQRAVDRGLGDALARLANVDQQLLGLEVLVRWPRTSCRSVCRSRRVLQPALAQVLAEDVLGRR